MPSAPPGFRARARPSAPTTSPARWRRSSQEHDIDPEKTLTVGLSVAGARPGAARSGRPWAATRALTKTSCANCARLRTPEELAAAQRATAIAERGYQHMLETVRPGMREYRARGRTLLLHEGARRRGQFPPGQRLAAQSRGAGGRQPRARRRRHHPVRDHALLSGPVRAALPHHRHRRRRRRSCAKNTPCCRRRCAPARRPPCRAPRRARCARRWTTASAPPATATIAARPICACAATASASPPTCPATWSTRASARWRPA